MQWEGARRVVVAPEFEQAPQPLQPQAFHEEPQAMYSLEYYMYRGKF